RASTWSACSGPTAMLCGPSTTASSIPPRARGSPRTTTCVPCWLRPSGAASGQAARPQAKRRGLRPRYVSFVVWYSGKDNLKAVAQHGWLFLAQVRCNRRVNLDRQGNRAISELPISASGTTVHLEGFGLVKAFRIVTTNGDTEHWITNDLEMDELTRREVAELAWGIEDYHRGLKQFCGAERCQARHPRAQRNHVGMAIRTFLRLEYHRFTTGVSWFQAKFDVVREAVKRYLALPLYGLPNAATA